MSILKFLKMWKEFCHTSENGTHIAHKYRMSDTQREDYNICGDVVCVGNGLCVWFEFVPNHQPNRLMV